MPSVMRTMVARPTPVAPYVPSHYVPPPVFDATSVFGGPGDEAGLTTVVEIAPGAVLTDDPDTWPWVDITAYAIRDPVTIRRGRRDEASRAAPSECRLTLDNSDGRFVARNPLGAYYPDLTQGCPVRVRLVIAGISYTRFVGYLYELPPRWQEGLADQFVPVVANGILRRVQTLAVTLGTAQDAAATAAVVDPTLVAYWPCTDAAGSGSAASSMSGVPPMIANADVVFAAVDGPNNVGRLPNLATGGLLTASVPTPATMPSPVEFAVSAAIKANKTHTAENDPLAVTLGSGTAPYWYLEYDFPGNTLQLQYLDTDGNNFLALDTGSTTGVWDGQWHTVAFHLRQVGANVTATIYRDGVSVVSGSVPSVTIGWPSKVYLGDADHDSTGLSSGGQVAVRSSANAPSAAAIAAAAGNAAETTTDRFARLCQAAQLPVELVGASQLLMGAQPDADLPALLDECEDVEVGGVIVETLGGRLALHPQSLRANAPVALLLDLHDETADLEPTDDDRLVANDWTVSRSGGSSVRYTDEAAVHRHGRYTKSASVNVYADQMLVEQASGRAGLGTFEGLRHPHIEISLRAHPELVPAVLACDISARIQGANLLPGMAGDPLDVLVEGYTESFYSLDWRIVFATSPFLPHNIGVYADDVGSSDEHLGHYDWDTCVLAEDLDAGETAVDVTPVPLCSTLPDDYFPPPTVTVGGEDMLVISCTGAGPTQTLTVTRSVNGVVKTHTAGAVVELHPASAGYLAL